VVSSGRGVVYKRERMSKAHQAKGTVPLTGLFEKKGSAVGTADAASVLSSNSVSVRGTR